MNTKQVSKYEVGQTMIVRGVTCTITEIKSFGKQRLATVIGKTVAFQFEV